MPRPGSNPDEIRSVRCDLNHKLSNFAFLSTSLTGATFENQDVWMTHCGFPAAEFNTAFLKRPGTRNAEAIEIARQFFGDLSLPFKFRCRSDQVSACADALTDQGYERCGESPAMVLPQIPEEFPKPPAGDGDFELVEVETDSDLETYQRVAMEGFGIPSGAGKIFITKAFKELPNVRLYLGRVACEAVATSALIATDGVAGIYFVATLEGHRGRGLGAYLTMVAACGGRELGCDLASLQASEMGRPVYERLGFETPYDYTGFMRPEDAEDAATT